jgi:mRNA-degrading endonuclease RelE of RelBE toxin-antitoxin system
MTYEVYTTETFDKEMSKLSNSDKKILQKMFLQLKENPFVGDQIRYPFFREKRLREKRVYYLVYKDKLVVLMVALGGKKIQQETIDEIIKLLPDFKKYVERLFE